MPERKGSEISSRVPRLELKLHTSGLVCDGPWRIWIIIEDFGK